MDTPNLYWTATLGSALVLSLFTGQPNTTVRAQARGDAQSPSATTSPGTITGMVAGSRLCLSIATEGPIYVFTDCAQVDEVILDASTADSQHYWRGEKGTYNASNQELDGPYFALRSGRSFSFGDANTRNQFWVCPASMAPVASGGSPATVDSTDVECAPIPPATMDSMLKTVDQICASNRYTCLPPGQNPHDGGGARTVDSASSAREAAPVQVRQGRRGETTDASALARARFFK